MVNLGLNYADGFSETKSMNTVGQFSIVLSYDDLSWDLNNAKSITVKIGNADGYINDVNIDVDQIEDKRQGIINVKLDDNFMADFPPDIYYLEVWADTNEGRLIFPSQSVLTFTIDRNIMSNTGSVARVTLYQFQENFNELKKMIQKNQAFLDTELRKELEEQTNIKNGFSNTINSKLQEVESKKNNSLSSLDFKANDSQKYLDGKTKDYLQELDNKAGDSYNYLDYKASNSYSYLDAKANDSKNYIDGKTQDGVNSIDNKASDSKNYIDGKAEDAVNSIDNKANDSKNYIDGKAKDATNNISEQSQELQNKQTTALNNIDFKASDSQKYIDGTASQAKSDLTAFSQARQTEINNRVNQLQLTIVNEQQQYRDNIDNMNQDVQNHKQSYKDLHDSAQSLLDQLKSNASKVPLSVDDANNMNNEAQTKADNAQNQAVQQSANYTNQKYDELNDKNNILSSRLEDYQKPNLSNLNINDWLNTGHEGNTTMFQVDNLQLKSGKSYWFSLQYKDGSWKDGNPSMMFYKNDWDSFNGDYWSLSYDPSHNKNSLNPVFHYVPQQDETIKVRLTRWSSTNEDVYVRGFAITQSDNYVPFEQAEINRKAWQSASQSDLDNAKTDLQNKTNDLSSDIQNVSKKVDNLDSSDYEATNLVDGSYDNVTAPSRPIGQAPIIDKVELEAGKKYYVSAIINGGANGNDLAITETDNVNVSNDGGDKGYNQNLSDHGWYKEYITQFAFTAQKSGTHYVKLIRGASAYDNWGYYRRLCITQSDDYVSFEVAQKNRKRLNQTGVLTSINNKTDNLLDRLTDLNNGKADKVQMYGKTDINTMVNDLTDAKADKVNVYSKSDIDEKVDNVNARATDLNNGKADKTNVYSKTDIDGKVDNVNSRVTDLNNGKADKTGVYGKTDIDLRTNQLSDTKADKTDVYSKSDIDSKISNVYSSANSYTEEQIQSIKPVNGTIHNGYNLDGFTWNGSFTMGKVSLPTLGGNRGLDMNYTEFYGVLKVESYGGFVRQFLYDNIGNQWYRYLGNNAPWVKIPSTDDLASITKNAWRELEMSNRWNGKVFCKPNFQNNTAILFGSVQFKDFSNGLPMNGVIICTNSLNDFNFSTDTWSQSIGGALGKSQNNSLIAFQLITNYYNIGSQFNLINTTVNINPK